jgi:hypothetical protein
MAQRKGVFITGRRAVSSASTSRPPPLPSPSRPRLQAKGGLFSAERELYLSFLQKWHKGRGSLLLGGRRSARRPPAGPPQPSHCPHLHVERGALHNSWGSLYCRFLQKGSKGRGSLLLGSRRSAQRSPAGPQPSPCRQRL